MKREDITALLPEITKEQLDKIMDLHGRDIQAQSNTITTLTAERDGLKTQLADATTEIQSYKDMDIDGIKTKAAEWETKLYLVSHSAALVLIPSMSMSL